MKRHVLPFICALLVPLCALALVSCAEVTEEKSGVVIYNYDGNEDEVVLQNSFLELRFLPKTAEFLLLEKTSGTVWRSNPEGASEDVGADSVTKQLMQSQFSLLYADEAGVGMTLSSSRYSVEKAMYEYALVDGGLEVHYTVGNIARTFVFPPAAPEKRMLVFLEQMPAADRRKVDASYRLIDINKLRATDDKGALLAAYPGIEDEPVYVLRDNTQEHMKAQIEEFFTAAGYTLEDYDEDVARYDPSGASEKPVFNVTLRYELDGPSLLVSVPFDKIAYRKSYPVTQLQLLPFFGAGGLEDEGYLFVPDGSGALITFNNGKQGQNAYSNNVYGWDEGLSREAVISDNKAPYPVFGIQKNGAALLCIIEEGASYAGVRADVSGRNCSYNSVFGQFTLIHGALMDIAGKVDKAIYLYEAQLPAGERIVERFIPCAEDSYSGMAKEYRAYLQKNNPSLANVGASAPAAAGVPVAVEIIGAVNKIQHRLGFPLDLPLKLTSYKEAEAMAGDFARMGWKNAQIKLTGWFNGSVDHSVPSGIKLIGDLGSKKDFKNLAGSVKKNGYGFYAEGDFLYMKDDRLFDGFSLFGDAARYVSRRRVETYPYSFVWFGERKDWGKLAYLARPAYMQELVGGFVTEGAKLGIENIAFRTIGSKLGGDYNEKRLVSREASMNMQRELLAQLKQSGTGVLVNSGYVYTLPYADFITDLALGDQGFGITDEPVPFYEIAIHGLVPYTGRAINLAEDYTKNLLKTIETGAGLYFSFMTEETAVLQETKFRQFYANEYGKWVHDADALYQRFTKDFDGLYNQTIEDHQILAPGVTVTTYGNGVKVLVNASEAAYRYNGQTIRANDYAVTR
ncbi:hypothetical protein FACS1894147_04020 [Spirochaetia bacterium]|nr:hypothetical protein FACS1894147_04020 [Spirochaetia bacterium]